MNIQEQENDHKNPKVPTAVEKRFWELCKEKNERK